MMWGIGILIVFGVGCGLFRIYCGEEFLMWCFDLVN